MPAAAPSGRLPLGPDPGTNTVGISLGRAELATFHAEGVGTPVIDMEGDFLTWHLPAGAFRLGKGVLGEGDRAVAFSPDGQRLAVASGIGVWLYEVATSRAMALLRTVSPVYSVAISPDGAILASGLGNGQVELWEMGTGTSTGTLEHSRMWVTAVAFSPDGRSLAAGSEDQIIKLWDLETRAPVATWEVAKKGNGVRSTLVDFSPDGTMLVSGFDDGTVRLWDVATRQDIGTLEGHTDGVRSVAFSSDGRTLASGSLDGTVKLWDVETRQDIGTLEGHTDGVRSVAFSSDGRTLASGSLDGTVKLWDVGSRELVGTLEGHKNGVISVAFSPDGATLASGSWDGTIKLWDVGSRELVGTPAGHREGVSVAFSPDGAALASGSWDGTIKLWDVETQQDIGTLRGHTGEVLSVAFSPLDATLLASGSSNAEVKLWNAITGANLATFGNMSRVNSVAFSSVGATLASGTGEGTIELWDLSEWTGPRPWGLEIISGDGQQGAPGVALTQPLVVAVRDQYGDPLPEATVAFTVTAGEGQLSGRFAVEHTTTDANGRAELVLTLGPQPGPNIVGVSLGGHEVVTFTAQGVGTAVAELEGDYRTWHLPPAATVRLGKGALGEGDRAVALSADGRCLAVASGIGVWLYEAATSRALALLPSASPVHSVAFSLGGTLAAGLGNGQVELWEVETGERIGTLRHADWGQVTSVTFSPDGTRLASGSLLQIIKLWDVETRRVAGTWEASGKQPSWDPLRGLLAGREEAGIGVP